MKNEEVSGWRPRHKCCKIRQLRNPGGFLAVIGGIACGRSATGTRRFAPEGWGTGLAREW